MSEYTPNVARKLVEFRAYRELLWAYTYGYTGSCCGLPLMSVHREGNTLYANWKREYELMGVSFPYKITDYSYTRQRIGKDKLVFVYTMPVEIVGDSFAYVIVADKKEQIVAGYYITLIDDGKLLVNYRPRRGNYYVLGIANTLDEIGDIIVDTFDVVIKIRKDVETYFGW